MTQEGPTTAGATCFSLCLPQVAVDTVRVRRGRVDAWVGREAAPRRFEQADAVLRLGRNYHSLSVDLTSLVHLRDPETHKCARPASSRAVGCRPHSFPAASGTNVCVVPLRAHKARIQVHDCASDWIARSCRCTMTSPSAQRHLRDAPGGQLEAAGLLSGGSATADCSGTGAAAPQPPDQRWPGDRSAAPRATAAPEVDRGPAQVTAGVHHPPCTRFSHAHCTAGLICSVSAVQVVQVIRHALIRSLNESLQSPLQAQRRQDTVRPPAGGRVGARVRVNNMGVPGKMPQLSVVITGELSHQHA